MYPSLFMQYKAFGIHIIINRYNIHVRPEKTPISLTLVFFVLGVDTPKKLRIIRHHQLTIVN